MHKVVGLACRVLTGLVILCRVSDQRDCDISLSDISESSVDRFGRGGSWEGVIKMSVFRRGYHLRREVKMMPPGKKWKVLCRAV